MRVALLAASIVLAQEPVRIGPDVTVPKPVHREEPRAPANIRDIAVVHAVVIGADGRLTVVRPLTPSPPEFAAAARSALEKWRFAPAQRDGQPVAVKASIDMSFRKLEASDFVDTPALRAELNDAMRKTPGEGVQRVEALAKKYPPAQVVLANWLRRGEFVAKDEKRADKLINTAANARYAEAIALLVMKEHEKNPKTGTERLQFVAFLGSVMAQKYLGLAFSAGVGADKNLDAARHYYANCAEKGDAECQIRLAQLILNNPEELFNDWAVGISWLIRRANQNDPAARALIEKFKPRLPAERWAEAEAFAAHTTRTTAAR